MARMNEAFFSRDVLEVAPDLLGKIIVRCYNNSSIERYGIVEVEAYRGEDDLACHASKGRTKRTEVMYAQGGVVYVYLIYGIHWMLNVVTGPANCPQAVLIRGIDACIGPGRVSQRLKINRTFYGEDLLKPNRIWIEDHGFRPMIKQGPRIGIDYAGEPWRSAPWRYWV